VVGTEGSFFEVMIVGVGRAKYARDELLPRKIGQVRYAQRRAASWEALLPCVVLEARVGSHAWGLAGEGSDVDVRGLFCLPFSWTVGLVEPPVDLVSADGSTTYWEAGKAARQGLRADPNTLELLFADSVVVKDPIGQWFLEARESFVSADIYGSFGRYALSQLKKLSHSLRLAEHREVVFEWLRERPPPTLDEVARRLADVDQRVAPSRADAELAAKEYVKQLYRSLFDQGLLAERDFEALVDFASRRSERLELARELRPKNAYNLLRLIDTARRWFETGRPTWTVEGSFRDRLLSIKEGKVDLDDVLREAEAMTPALEAARQTTALPRHPDVSRVDALLRRVGEEMARRWVEKVPGPFGAEAPAAPTANWSDDG
jgi:predicted nucleotidyltransferase